MITFGVQVWLIWWRIPELRLLCEELWFWGKKCQNFVRRLIHFWNFYYFFILLVWQGYKGFEMCNLHLAVKSPFHVLWKNWPKCMTLLSGTSDAKHKQRRSISTNRTTSRRMSLWLSTKSLPLNEIGPTRSHWEQRLRDPILRVFGDTLSRRTCSVLMVWDLKKKSDQVDRNWYRCQPHTHYEYRRDVCREFALRTPDIHSRILQLLQQPRNARQISMGGWTRPKNS